MQIWRSWHQYVTLVRHILEERWETGGNILIHGAGFKRIDFFVRLDGDAGYENDNLVL